MNMMELINDYARGYDLGYREGSEEYRAVVEAVEKLERDAARYRWLMANCALGIKQFGLGWSLNTRQGIAPDSLKDVSAAIDAAMKEATNGQGT